MSKTEKEIRSATATMLAVDERRQHQRIEPEGGMVEVALAGETARFKIENLSEGGALVQGGLELALGTVLDIWISLPGAAPISITARVLRHTFGGGRDCTAMVFLRTSDELRDWISELVLQGLRAAFPEA